MNTTGALTSGGLLDLTNGILNAGGNITTASYAQSFGSVQGPGNLTVQGAATITFGDMRGPGTTILNGPTSLSSSGLWLDSGRTLQNNATFTWTGGSLDLNNNINGVSLPGTGAITNTAAGLFLVQGDFSTSLFASNYGGTDTGESATFTNAGTFRKTGSSAGNQTFVSTIFNNSGTVDVQTGTLAFTQGVQGSGALQIAPAGNLRLDAPSTTGNLIHNGLAATSLSSARTTSRSVPTTATPALGRATALIVAPTSVERGRSSPAGMRPRPSRASMSQAVPQRAPPSRSATSGSAPPRSTIR